MAFHKLVRTLAVGISLLLAAAAAADGPAKPNTLTPKEIADGWVLLFDGETTFGWTLVEGEAVVKDGRLVVGGPKPTKLVSAAEFGSVACKYKYHVPDGKGAAGGRVSHLDHKNELASAAGETAEVNWVSAEGRADPLTIETPANQVIVFEYFLVRPRVNREYSASDLAPLFNGKDLTGWVPYAGDPKRSRSKFTVTPAGELSVKDGPGDLQTEKQFDDFVLQLECKTNGKALNSGVFFRCLPGQYQQGYEAQVQNAYLGDDRTKPVDFGTGAIYRRVKARKVVSNDNEWFAMTVLARGPRIATWVNGYPVVSWTDERKPADNARNGLYTKKGPISLQGHDPTTDLLFRNIRIAELKKD